MPPATADLCDAHGDMLENGHLRVLAPGLIHFGGRTAFHGQITTLRLFEDNGLVRPTLETPGGGRVLVIDGGGSRRRALVGDQLAALAVKNGWNGIVVWGVIRDVAAIGDMTLGVVALGTHPQKTVKSNRGEVDVAVSISGAVLRPGEWLYADRDGILISAVPLHQP